MSRPGSSTPKPLALSSSALSRTRSAASRVDSAHASGRAVRRLRFDRREHARGAAQRGQHPLLRLVEAAGQKARGLAAVPPDVLDGHQQTRIVGRLQQVLQPPGAVCPSAPASLGGTSRKHSRNASSASASAVRSVQRADLAAQRARRRRPADGRARPRATARRARRSPSPAAASGRPAAAARGARRGRSWRPGSRPALRGRSRARRRRPRSARRAAAGIERSMVRSVARSLGSSTTGDQRLSRSSSRAYRRGRKRWRASSDSAKRAATIQARRSSPSTPGLAAEAAAMRGSRLTVATSSSTTAGTAHSASLQVRPARVDWLGRAMRLARQVGSSGGDGRHAYTWRTLVCVAQRVRPMIDSACRTPSSDSANGCGGTTDRRRPRPRAS